MKAIATSHLVFLLGKLLPVGTYRLEVSPLGSETKLLVVDHPAIPQKIRTVLLDLTEGKAAPEDLYPVAVGIVHQQTRGGVATAFTALNITTIQRMPATPAEPSEESPVS